MHTMRICNSKRCAEHASYTARIAVQVNSGFQLTCSIAVVDWHATHGLVASTTQHAGPELVHINNLACAGELCSQRGCGGGSQSLGFVRELSVPIRDHCVLGTPANDVAGVLHGCLFLDFSFPPELSVTWFVIEVAYCWRVVQLVGYVCADASNA